MAINPFRLSGTARFSSCNGRLGKGESKFKECPWYGQKDLLELTGCRRRYDHELTVTANTEEEVAARSKIEISFLVLGLVAMVFMVATWGIFKEKRSQKIVLMLASVAGLQSTILLVGFAAYPSAEERFVVFPCISAHVQP